MRYWLQWLAVLPAAVAAGILILVPVHFVIYRSLTGSGFITPYPELPERLVSPFFTAMAFVWAGAYVAPSHKFRTGQTLVVVWLVCSRRNWYRIVKRRVRLNDHCLRRCQDCRWDMRGICGLLLAPVPIAGRSIDSFVSHSTEKGSRCR
jgi:hypothetical protein